MQTKALGLPAFLIGVVLFAGGVACGAYYVHYTVTSSANTECHTKYPLTSKNIDCGEYLESSRRLKSIDSALEEATALYTKEGKAAHVSVWVRDLNTLQWASVNENDRYAPASLLKLPLMIAYFKLAEIEPTLMTTQFTYQLSPAGSEATQLFPPEQLLEVGKNYTVEQLITQAIVYSDNNAADVLAAHIDADIFNNVLLDLGIKIESSTGDTLHDFVTTKTYGAIFRTLYNASYLDQEYSEKALALLAKTSFNGIQAPLPAGTVVAHKFGERGINNQDGTATQELHDCGLIYKADNPYTICIMTKGTNTTDLLSVIKNISQLVYDKM